jgi:CBS domain containing-hemolysin-like protein
MSVMVPMSRVEAVDVKSDKLALLKKLGGSAFTRLAVYEGEATNIIGFVDMYEALSWSEEFADLRIFLKPIGRLDGDMAVTDAIHIMQSEKHKIVLVTRSGRGGREWPIGIVTMKDLAEELLGELAEW